MKHHLLRLVLFFIIATAIFSESHTTFAETNNVKLDVFVRGYGSYEGTFTYQMTRTYENTSATSETFSEMLPLGGEGPMNIGFFDVISKSDGLSLKEVDRGYYELSGELEPSEVKSITIYQQTDGYGGRSGGRKGSIMSDRFVIINVSENIKPNTLNLNFNYPKDIIEISDTSSLEVYYWDDKESTNIEARRSTVFPSDSWIVTNLDTPLIESASVSKIDFTDLGRMTMRVSYVVSLNTSSNRFVYIALSLASLSLLYCIILSRRMRKLTKDNQGE